MDSAKITSKKQLKDWISYELAKYGHKGGGVILPFTERYILSKHIKLLRKTEYHTNCGHRIRRIIYKLRLNKLQLKYCLHVPVNCCGRGLKIMHVGPVLINNKAHIGSDCSLHINTSIVAGGVNSGAPVLGNGIVVGVGAVILGPVHIADYVAIGANAVVNKDVVEQNIAVAGVPAKKISNNGRLSWGKKD